jgi:hypothetical protein
MNGDAGGQHEVVPTTQPHSGYWPLPYREHVQRFYERQTTELVVAGLIFSNFFMQCCQTQIDPDASTYAKVWTTLEDIFNVAFAIELMVNAYGRWCKPFFRSSWNCFDVLVVTIGILDLSRAEYPGPLRMLRMARAFRVFRLFGKVESLKRILKSLNHALPGVVNSFVLILLMMCIYAVLSVEFFRHVYEDCKDPEGPVAEGEWYFGETARGKCVGPEYYGRFLTALYTLFQVLTGESWSEACVRPLLVFFEKQDSDSSIFGVAFFFISFILVNGVVLLNVVVTVLLDGMQKQDDDLPPDAGGADKIDDELDPQTAFENIHQKLTGMKEDLANTEENVRNQLADVLLHLKGSK